MDVLKLVDFSLIEFPGATRHRVAHLNPLAGRGKMDWVQTALDHVSICFEVVLFRCVVHDGGHGRYADTLRPQFLRPINLLFHPSRVVVVYVFHPTQKRKQIVKQIFEVTYV